MVPSLAAGRCIFPNLTADFAFVLYDSSALGCYPVEVEKDRPTRQQFTLFAPITAVSRITAVLRIRLVP